MEQDGKKIVYIVKGNVATKREVVLSEGNSTQVIVESGIQRREQVVIKGQSQLRDQARVRIVNP